MTLGVKSRRKVTEGIIDPGEKEGCWEQARAEGVTQEVDTVGSCQRQAREAGESRWQAQGPWQKLDRNGSVWEEPRPQRPSPPGRRGCLVLPSPLPSVTSTSVAFDRAPQEAGRLRSLGKAAAQGEPTKHTAEQREAQSRGRSRTPPSPEGERARTMAQWQAPPSADDGPHVNVWSGQPAGTEARCRSIHPAAPWLGERQHPFTARPCPTDGIRRVGGWTGI